MTDSTLPRGAALTARDSTFRDDPHPVYDRVRATSPVYADPAYGRSLVTGYADVRALLRSRFYGADARNAREDSYMRRVAGTGVNEGRGDTLTLSLAAANRDPAVFDDPHRSDIRRAHNPHLGFGSGIHACLGAPLARLEAQIGLGAFIARFPSIRPGSSAPVRRDLPFFRGFERLPLRLNPA